MAHLSWRQRWRPIIRRVLYLTSGEDEKAIRRALREAYPLDSRESYAYRIWRNEAKRQRGLKRRERPRWTQIALPLLEESP